MTSVQLTICFEDPFWVALVELDDNGNYQVARHVFGPEPTDPEIVQFVRDNWRRLRFTPDMRIEKKGGRKINPKRLRRLIEKEIASCATRGTKAQQALAEQREANKLERKKKTREEREAEKQADFERRQQKRKQKHRGH